MKRLVQKILYKNLAIKQYSSITLNGNISESVFLKINDSLIDVSKDHWAVCLQPMVFAIWIDTFSFTFSANDNLRLLFEEANPQKKLAEVQLTLLNSIEERNGILLLAKANKCKLFHTSLMEMFFLYFRYYRKQGFSFKKFSSCVSAFSYPRKVRLVSFQSEGYYNIFPMDFIGKLGGTNQFIFGLRHTNHALEKIIKAKKLVVSEVPAVQKKEIYQLGSHHSSCPPSLDELPYKTYPSKNFGFPVPSWTESYREIEITRTMNLGSHMLLLGESYYEERKTNEQVHLYHVHFLLSLYQQRKGTAYTEV